MEACRSGSTVCRADTEPAVSAEVEGGGGGGDGGEGEGWAVLRKLVRAG